MTALKNWAIERRKTYLLDGVIDIVAPMRAWRYKHLSKVMKVIISCPQEKKQDAVDERIPLI